MTKREEWELIQQRDPKLAELLKAIRQHFGKPEIKFLKFAERKVQEA